MTTHWKGVAFVQFVKDKHMSKLDSLLPKEILAGLSTDFIKHIHYFKAIDSTNEFAKQLAKKGAVEGSVVIAETQEKGRGRLGRAWLSPFGGVWLSLLLRPKITLKEAVTLTLMASVVTAKTFRKLYKLNAKIKWPNDILINERKVCGILTESGADNNVVSWAVVGIGINANINLEEFPSAIQKSATSLKEELKKPVSRIKLIRNLLKQFEKDYKIFLIDKNRILEVWRKFSDTLGREVKIVAANEVVVGKAMDIDNFGALIIKVNGTKKVITGDCIHLSKIKSFDK